jgi:Protein of unknown function (DUF2690)
MQRILAAIAIVLTSALTAALGPSTPASAAWYCGDACNRTDPSSYIVSPYQTCADDATTKDSVYNSNHGVTLQLRYSPYCRTIWGRIYGGGQQNYYVGLVLVDDEGEEYVLNATREIPYENRSYNWSYQWNDAGVTIKACVSTTWSFDPHWLIMCTRVY